MGSSPVCFLHLLWMRTLEDKWTLTTILNISHTLFLSHNQQCQSSQSTEVVVVKSTYEPYAFSHSVATSSAKCNCYSPTSSLVCGQLLTTRDIVRHLPQGHMSVAIPSANRQETKLQMLLLTGCTVALVGPEAI